MEGDNTNDLYKECLRNHAANLGNYANDGCGEFTLDDTLPGALQCAACGCHRNFHRKVTNYNRDPEITTDIIDYGGGSNVRLSLERSGKKRFRTKFTADQKEKMLEFAAKLGWKLQRTDQEDEIERFCKWVGVSRKVFKVWMHNHKSSSSTSSISTGNASSLTQ